MRTPSASGPDNDIVVGANAGTGFVSRTSSSIFCLSFLICSSLKATSSFGRARSSFSAPRRFSL